MHQLLAARQPAAQDPTALVRHPHRLHLTPPQQHRQRASVEPVSLSPRLRDPGVIRADHDHAVHVGLEQPRDLPAAARHLQRDPVRRQQALRQRRETIRRARHATDGADLPVLANRDHTEIAVHIQADRTTNPSRQRHLSPPSTVGLTVSGRTSGTTTQTDTSSQLNPGKSQGRPNEKHGLEAHRSKRPTRLRSPKKAPVPDEPESSTTTERNLQQGSFMPRKGALSGASNWGRSRRYCSSPNRKPGARSRASRAAAAEARTVEAPPNAGAGAGRSRAARSVVVCATLARRSRTVRRR